MTLGERLRTVQYRQRQLLQYARRYAGGNGIDYIESLTVAALDYAKAVREMARADR